jgi:polar amino acid transport system ATP-binding protein
MNGTRLRLSNVEKSFGDRQVLSGIDLSVAPGEVICLIGASGSGKSTLLRCCNLLEPIDSGAIVLDGIDISAPGLDPDPHRRRIGMVFQSFNLFPHLSVLDNVAVGPRHVLGRPRTDARQRAIELLTRLGLDGHCDAFPDQLSGGQQQRVAIARSLAVDPDVLLLDEITSALDPELVGEVLDVVRTLKTSGMTMVMATHEMGFAREIADIVCFLHEGRILESGPPDVIFEQPTHDRTRAFLRRVLDAGRM